MSNVPKTAQSTYDFLFGVCKAMENGDCRHSFSAHGKTDHLRFDFVFTSDLFSSRSNVGRINFRPVGGSASLVGTEPLDSDFIAGIKASVEKHRRERRRESNQAFDLLLDQLKDRVLVTRSNTWIRTPNKKAFVEAEFNGVLVDEDHGTVLGYIDVCFDFIPGSLF